MAFKAFDVFQFIVVSIIGAHVAAFGSVAVSSIWLLNSLDMIQEVSYILYKPLVHFLPRSRISRLS